MVKSSLVIKKSKIQGRGIFAATSFRKGQEIFRAEGPVINYAKPQSWRLGPHWINVGENQWMVPYARSIWRFINHSCEPNAIIARGRKVVALRLIRPDEEVTIDYSFTESQATWHMSCRCRSAQCRKVVRSVHFLPEPLFQKHRRYVQTFLKREYARHKTELIRKGTEQMIIAKRPLHKGETIFKVEGPTILYKRPPNYWLGYRWLWVGRNSWIIPEEDNPWNFMRHSCNPNVGLNDAREVVALKAIRRNEELSIDNSITEADPRWRMKCACGAQNCRRIVRAIQFLPTETFRKYLPHIPSFLQKVYTTEVARSA